MKNLINKNKLYNKNNRIRKFIIFKKILKIINRK